MLSDDSLLFCEKVVKVVKRRSFSTKSAFSLIILFFFFKYKKNAQDYKT
jgi:hypothetical protein